MEKLGQDLHALREKVQDQQAQQLQTYSVAVENKSNMDFYEELKQSGENLAIDPNMTRRPPQPTIVPDAPHRTRRQRPGNHRRPRQKTDGRAASQKEKGRPCNRPPKRPPAAKARRRAPPVP